MLKACLYILQNNKEKLLAMKFDELLIFLCEVSKIEAFSVLDDSSGIEYIKNKPELKYVENIKEGIKGITLKNSLLRRIEEEYHSFNMKINQKILKYEY